MGTGRLIPAAAYLRMSSDKQDTSIAQQKLQLIEFAKERFEIVAWYMDEGKSGSKDTDKRTDFTRMLAEAPKAVWEVVLCLDISRFGRLDSIEGAFAKKTLRDAGKKLHSLIEGEIDWNSTTGRIVDTVLSEAQHDYSFRLGQKTLTGKLDAFRRGELFGFKCPYGMARKIWDNLGTERIVPRTENFAKPKGWRATLIPGDPEEVEVVRWLFETFSSRDVGYRWLAAELNREGKQSPTGQKWCAKVVENILDNEKYVGDMRLGRTGGGAFWRLEGDKVVRSKSPVSTSKTDFLTLQSTHQGLVEPALWNRVQLKKKRRKAAHSHSHKEGGYLLKGVLYCGNCEKPLYGNPNCNRKKSGRIIYVCKTAVKYGRQCSCGQWSVQEEDILPFVVRTLIQQIDRKLLYEASSKPPHRSDHSEDVAALERKLTELVRKIDQGTERFLTASPELIPEIATKLAEWKKQRERLQSMIEKARHDCDPSWDETLKRRRVWFESMKERLLRIETTRRYGKHGYSASVHFTTDSFRELLVSHGCRVDIWWSKRSACRWRVARIRIRMLDHSEDLDNEVFDRVAGLQAAGRRLDPRTQGQAAHFVPYSSLIV